MKAVKFLLFIALITFVSCEKAELPEQALGTPVFNFSGLVGGESKSFTAGVDDYYLFTKTFTDSNEVLIYSGQLGPIGSCPSFCTESITIEFREGGDPLVDVPTFDPQPLEFYNGLVDDEMSSMSLQLAFINNSLVSEEAEFFWDFGNGLTSTLKNPAPMVYSPDFSVTPFDVSLSVSSVFGCTQTEVISFDMGTTLVPDCNLILSDEPPVTPTAAEICGIMDGEVPSSTSWMSDVSFAEMNCLPIAGLAVGEYTVSASNALGCVDQEVLTVVDFGGELEYCNANFQVVASQVPVQNINIDKIGLGRINIKYTDANGVTYQSGSVADQTDRLFRVISSEAYEDNENGEATRLIVFEFDALLVSEQGEYIEIQNAEGTWAVGVE